MMLIYRHCFFFFLLLFLLLFCLCWWGVSPVFFFFVGGREGEKGCAFWFFLHCLSYDWKWDWCTFARCFFFFSSGVLYCSCASGGWETGGTSKQQTQQKKGRIVCVAKAAFEAFATETRVPLFKWIIEEPASFCMLFFFLVVTLLFFFLLSFHVFPPLLGISVSFFFFLCVCICVLFFIVCVFERLSWLCALS